MVTVLSHDHPGLVDSLRGSFARTANMSLHAFGSLDALSERAERVQPDVVILVAGLASPEQERHVARKLRRDLGARTQILLAIPTARHTIPEDLTLYDGIVSLDDPDT